MSGTKVTDPHSIIQESAGPVAADSLAAESSTFQSSNRNAEPLGVSGSNSTFANTDTSGTKTLPAAQDASQRLSSTDQEGKYPDNKVGQDKNAAVEGTYTNPQNSVDKAPTYVDTTLHAADIHGAKPKGKNLKEGDAAEFEGAENASFGGDSGGKSDPGRLAEREFERMEAGGVVGAGVERKGGKEGTAFDVLSDEAA